MQAPALEGTLRGDNQRAVPDCPSSTSAVDGGVPASTHVPVPTPHLVWDLAVGDGHFFIVCLAPGNCPLADHTDDRGDHLPIHSLIVAISIGETVIKAPRLHKQVIAKVKQIWNATFDDQLLLT